MRPWLILFALFAIVVGAWWGTKHPKGGLEITQAPVWSDLQSIEAQHRDDPHLTTPVVLKAAVNRGRYDVAGLQSDSSRSPYVWIVLNGNAGANGLFTLPHDVSYTLACADIKSLEGQSTLDPQVTAALHHHCTP
jgi:hypothetical protein